LTRHARKSGHDDEVNDDSAALAVAEASAPHMYPDAPAVALRGDDGIIPRHASKRWIPARVLLTPSARRWPLADQIASKAAALGSEIVELRADRVSAVGGESARDAYVRAKSTLVVVVSPPGQRTLQPIPPSADWQFHLARGCPAHCQYCYLAGSLAGPPVTRVYANLPEILDGLRAYAGTGHVTSTSAARASEGTTFEASCYTDPLALEHLTGALAQTVAYFGAWEAAVQLRFTTKFDDVATLRSIDHRCRTRVRFSVNARSITRRFEGGTASLDDRLAALESLARTGYPVGLTIAPIMPFEGWRDEYDALFDNVRTRLRDVPNVDLSVELITHRFTPGSKDVLSTWYPASKLEMDETARSRKLTKFGSVKWVYPKAVMTELRSFFYDRIAAMLPTARILYWT
jgi:spore photoproduct lyase